MIWIAQQQAILIQKNGARLLEGNAVLSLIAGSLAVVPSKVQFLHRAIVTTLYWRFKEERRRRKRGRRDRQRGGVWSQASRPLGTRGKERRRIPVASKMALLITGATAAMGSFH